MSYYEELTQKANLCRLAAIRASDPKVKEMWMQKAQALEDKAMNLPLSLAGRM